jgi:epoxyqueuosine reductase
MPDGHPVNGTASASETSAQSIKDYALQLGFDACGIARAVPIDPEDRLGDWLRAGYHADMAWMERTQAIRQDVGLKLPGARSVIVVARNYYQPSPDHLPGFGRVARYAWGRDYHKVLMRPLKALAAFVERLTPGTATYAEIDTGPVLERAWAARAGIGWIGKNGMVLRRDMGSWFFLGVVITTVELSADAPMPDYCGDCRRCIDACPTDAIVAPKTVDARRCIAYHTIENRGEIPEPVQEHQGAWVFGCDLCQEACPWNQRFAKTTTEVDFLRREGVATPSVEELVDMDEAAFLNRFQGTPVMRATYSGLRRNARIAQKNTKRP